MEYLNLLIKPASGKCNMSCAYCFYRDEMEQRAVGDRGVMSLETLELIIERAYREAKSEVTFSFQGGEPTLAGLDFFRKVAELEKRYNTRGIKTDNSIQTNGLLLDDDWCAFLKENDFLVGVSLDGTESMHDRCRKDAGLQNTYSRVMASIDTLRKHGCSFNILAVVTEHSASNAKKIYDAFSRHNFGFLQFIPCMDRLGSSRGKSPYSLSPAKYGKFLCDLFDCWFEDLKKGKYVSVRHFDNWIGILMGRAPETCSMRGECFCYGCIESDGSVYPCDFYVLDEWKLGNIEAESFEELLNGEKAKRFVESSSPKPDECKSCEYMFICRGGCRRNRPLHSGIYGKDSYCKAYKEFFAKNLSNMELIAKCFL